MMEGVIRLRRASSLVILTCIALSGCLSGFKHPLGPAGEGFVEPQLLGRWECVSTEDPSPGPLTILDFDGNQYYLELESEKEETGRFRAYATRIEGVTFLNVRPIGPKPEDEWAFLAYAFVDPDHLVLRYVNPQPFEDVIDDPLGVSGRLAAQLEDPEVVSDYLSCTRAEAGD
jgi:hypothetical protein